MDEAVERLRKQFTRQDALLKALKSEGIKITKKQLTEKLKNTEQSLELTRAKKLKVNDFKSVKASSIGSNFQFDFMYMPNYKRNRNLRYGLLAIDIYSRKAWIAPSKTRENPGQQIVNMIENLIKLKILNINCDQEFNTNVLNDYAKKEGIKMWYSTRDQINKNPNVERLVRTIRQILLSYEKSNNDKYIDNIDKIIEDNYNDVKHSSVKASPNDIFFKNILPIDRKDKSELSDLKIGDIVKRKEIEGQFTKRSSTGKFSVQNFLIIKGNGYTYYLKNLSTNSILVKPFRYYELKKVPIESLRTKIQREKVTKFINENNKNKTEEQIEKKLKHDGINPKNIIIERRRIK